MILKRVLSFAEQRVTILIDKRLIKSFSFSFADFKQTKTTRNTILYWTKAPNVPFQRPYIAQQKRRLQLLTHYTEGVEEVESLSSAVSADSESIDIDIVSFRLENGMMYNKIHDFIVIVIKVLLFQEIPSKTGIQLKGTLKNMQQKLVLRL